MTQTQVFITIIVVAIVTLMTRVIPFLIFPENKETPAYIEYLGKVLPFSVMGMLVVYCFKSISILAWPHALPEIIAGMLVVILHKWKHNLLLSIAGGTIIYMILVQVVF